MIVASSGWSWDYHYVMIRDDETLEISMSIKPPHGGTVERRTSCFEVAKDYVYHLSVNKAKRNES